MSTLAVQAAGAASIAVSLGAGEEHGRARHARDLAGLQELEKRRKRRHLGLDPLLPAMAMGAAREIPIAVAAIAAAAGIAAADIAAAVMSPTPWAQVFRQ